MESSGFDFKAPQFLESLEDEARRGEDNAVSQFFGVNEVSIKDEQSSDEDNDVYMTPKAPAFPRAKERVFLKAKRRSSGIPSCRSSNAEMKDNLVEQDSVTSSSDMNQTVKSEAMEDQTVIQLDVKADESPNVTQDESMLSDVSDLIPWKMHKMETRADTVKLTPTMNLRSRSVVREGGLKRTRDNPGSAVQSASSKRPKLLTFAKTPNLRTKFRTRPRTALTQDEREALLMEEIKKHPIKPVPLNEKILHSVEACSKPATRPSTIPKPFHLSEFKRKMSVAVEEEPFQFKARPYIPTTNRKSLRPRKFSMASDSGNGVTVKAVDGVILRDHQKSNINIAVQPFSFDERDKERFRKKEEKIKKIIEEEAKGREFHANPLPSYIRQNRTMSVISEEGCADSTTTSFRSTRSTKRDDEKENKRFVAQPPKVLYKKPFQPKKPEKQPLEPLNIQLHTQKRAEERAEQEVVQNMLLLKNLELREENQKLREVIEKEELKELRKKLVHKAKPAPNFPLPEDRVSLLSQTSLM